jgi:signal transduction histidine kinase
VRKFSLTKRLIATVVVSHLALAACLALVGTFYARHYLRLAFDISLEGRARSVAALVYYSDDGKASLLFEPSKAPRSEHIRHLDFFVVRSSYRNFEAHTQGYDPSVFDNMPRDAVYWDFTFENEPYRAIVLHDLSILDTEEGIPQPPPKLTVIYAVPSEDIGERVEVLAASIAGISLLLVFPTLLLTVWSIRRSVAPLHQLATQAAAVSVSNWEFNPSERERSVAELQPLISALETVLTGLQRAFTRQREFLGDATHELKTSFAIIKSTLQSLLNRQRPAEEYRRGLIDMSEDSDRLEDLLDRMLRLARVEQWAADGAHRQLEPTDVASTCEMAVARMGKLAAKNGIAVEFSCKDIAEMPADPADLELVWTNLLENAVKYSEPQSTVTIELRRENSTAIVAITDSGCGIPESELPHIFERFRRGDPSRSRATGGYGLGLAIAKSVVEAYGGTIHASSKVDHGSCISVRLPLSGGTPRSAPEQPTRHAAPQDAIAPRR